MEENDRPCTDAHLLSRIAHEWRSSVAAASNWLQVLGKPNIDAGMRERAVKGIAQSRDIQLELIDQLQDTVLMVGGTLALDQSTFELTGALAAAIESSRELGEQRRIELAADLPRARFPVSGDAQRLEQALSHILLSTVRATAPRGRVEVVLQPAGRLFQVFMRSSDAVQSRSQLSQLLELPAPARLPAIPPAPGLGVAVPFARYVVERHGGQVRLEADGTRGIAYTITVPALAPVLSPVA